MENLQQRQAKIRIETSNLNSSLQMLAVKYYMHNAVYSLSFFRRIRRWIPIEYLFDQSEKGQFLQIRITFRHTGTITYNRLLTMAIFMSNLYLRKLAIGVIPPQLVAINGNLRDKIQ